MFEGAAGRVGGVGMTGCGAGGTFWGAGGLFITPGGGCLFLLITALQFVNMVTIWSATS